MKEGEVRLNLRLPTELHAAITERAQLECRSLNSQIIHALLEYLVARFTVAPVRRVRSRRRRQTG